MVAQAATAWARYFNGLLGALEQAPRRFDAVLSDESMPRLTGTELAAAARRLRPELPVLLMSGYVSPALAARARAAGMRTVLGKPLVARDIALALAQALAQFESVSSSRGCT